MRPSSIESRRRRDQFAQLVAADLREGGLDQAHANVVRHARDCRLKAETALRLSYDPAFVADVARRAGVAR